MTQDEIIEMARQTGWHDALLDVSFVLPTLTDFAKLVATKAIAELESQKPVAFLDWYDNAHWGNEDFKEGCHRSWNAAIKYAIPPAAQRTWVGLTDDEFNELYDRYVPITCYALLIEKVEAKLKDKNCAG